MGLWYSAAERRQSVAPGVSPGLVSFWHTSPVGAKESFAPTGLRSSRKKTPGLRPGLHSVAAPRLSMAAHFGQLSPTAVMSRIQKTFSPVDLRTAECIAAVIDRRYSYPREIRPTTNSPLRFANK